MRLATTLTFILLGSTAAYAQTSRDMALTPSLETRQAIEAITPRNGSSSKGPRIFKELKIDPKSGGPCCNESSNTSARGGTVAIAAQDTMIVQFQPDTTQSQIDDYVKTNKFEVVNTFPTLGAVQIRTDLSRFFQPKLTDNSVNDAVIRGLLDASAAFKKDPRVREATPDLVLRGQADVANFMIATNVADQNDATKLDWGIKDIQADQLWSLEGASDGAIFGVMDVGFGRHRNLVYIDLLNSTPIEDHGTHVSGIACGRAKETSGINGVIPNCLVRARYGDVFFESVQPGQVTKFFALFSQILASLTTFVDSYDDVSVFNISLGYNWTSNFGINPDKPESSQWKSLVEIQGPLLVTLLQNAEKKGKIIFSAAGNDSTGLSPPIDAKYASPFNWAAITARELGIKNGVIVEAHDKMGKRAPFSNTGGHISCPGVNILSTVAFNAQRQPSKSAYGEMSGTSMASPYCASGLVLFRLVQKKYSSQEALECILSSSVKSDSGVPMLKLKAAIEKCP